MRPLLVSIVEPERDARRPSSSTNSLLPGRRTSILPLTGRTTTVSRNSGCGAGVAVGVGVGVGVWRQHAARS